MKTFWKRKKQEYHKGMIAVASKKKDFPFRHEETKKRARTKGIIPHKLREKTVFAGQQSNS